MSPGSIVFSGIGHWISLIFQPAGSFHFTSVGRPASPENFQYVCQPGAIRSSNPTVKGFPGTTTFVSARSSALTSSFPWYVWPCPCGARAKSDKQTIEYAASRNAVNILLGSTRRCSRQSAPAGRSRGELGRHNLWNNEDLIGPWIFYFAARHVAAYIDISSTRIERADDVPRFARNRFGCWKFCLWRGSVRRRQRFRFCLRGFLATHARSSAR